MEFDSSVRGVELRKLFDKLIGELKVINGAVVNKALPEETHDTLINDADEYLQFYTMEFNKKYWGSSGFGRYFNTPLEEVWEKYALLYISTMKKEKKEKMRELLWDLFVALWELEECRWG